MIGTLKKNNKGFTIIEVLIVLAIAGLILLIVFLAVPALQRNSRNTSRKNDISRLLGASQEVINNADGSIASLSTTSLSTAVGTLGYYASGSVTVAAAPKTATGAADTDTVIVYTGSTCEADPKTGVKTGKGVAGTSRQIAVVYKIEPSTPQCTNS